MLNWGIIKGFLYNNDQLIENLKVHSKDHCSSDYPKEQLIKHHVACYEDCLFNITFHQTKGRRKRKF